MKLIARTVMAMARPGGNHNHGIDSSIVSDCASQELTIIDAIELALREHAAARVWLLQPVTKPLFGLAPVCMREREREKN